MMDTKIDLREMCANFVYLRPVDVVDLPEDVRAQVDGIDTLYAVHGADGEQLALVADRNVALEMAAHNDLQTVRLH